MAERSDVVVVGAGPNALVAAAYLIHAGLSVTVLEERDVVGGGAATEELTLPGYYHDVASSIHPLIQFNPLVAADELGLIANHGLRYVGPDPAVAAVSADGEAVLSRRGVARTAAEIARYSKTDAATYTALLEEWEEVLPLLIKGLAGPPRAVTSASGEKAQRLAKLMASTASAVVEAGFEDDRTRTLMLAPGGHDPFTQPGSGFVPVHWAGMISRVSTTHAIGGSGALPKALRSYIESNGGKILCGRLVERIVVENGRASAVITADGERFGADRAVVSSAYVTQLPALLGGEHLPPEFEERLDHWQHGPAIFVVHLAVEHDPSYRTVDGLQPVAFAATGTAAGYARQRADILAGRLSDRERWGMTMCSSIADPSRAPSGHSTVKLLTTAPYGLDGDPANWNQHKERYADELVETFAEGVEGYEPGDELARAIHTPVDLERWNRNFVEGGFTGGDLGPAQMGLNRPVPGWSGYRMPVPGLYLTGAGTFPGTGISGWPGRNAAGVVLDDLGIGASKYLLKAGEEDTMPPRDGSGVPTPA